MTLFGFTLFVRTSVLNEASKLIATQQAEIDRLNVDLIKANNRICQLTTELGVEKTKCEKISTKLKAENKELTDALRKAHKSLKHSEAVEDRLTREREELLTKYGLLTSE